MPDCPDWVDDIPLSDPVFRAALLETLRLVQEAARAAIVDSTHLRRWHRTAFEKFVPLDYYAGNFRQDREGRPCLGVDVRVGPIDGAPYRDVPFLVNQLLLEFRRDLGSLELRWAFLPPHWRALEVSSAIAGLIGGFIRVHPFINGNGRVSRMIWDWGLRRFDCRPQVRIAPRPEPPYERVMALAMQGDDRPLGRWILDHLSAFAPGIRS